MKSKEIVGACVAGACAGAVTGLLGTGGGMILIPLLTLLTKTDDEAVFPTSVSIILPICLVSLVLQAQYNTTPWQQALPYLIGSALGGLAAGIWGRRIPTSWLRRLLGIFVLWGGIRYLC